MSDPLTKAIETLRGGLSALETTPDLAAIQRGRDEVYARFGPLFSPGHLPTLTAEEFSPFLDFKVNRHWSGIHRYKNRLTSDMDILRQALGVLTDEDSPLPQRYDRARGLVDGLGRATATPILHVVYPDRYGVWNSKSEAGLKEIGLLPSFPHDRTDGQKYEEINHVLLRLAEALEIDLWTLDTLWEWITSPRKLAPPFDAIFADRAQAEWAFDLFADAVERLGGGLDDPRFALTLPHSNMMRLNIGNSIVMDFSNHGQTFHLTALTDEMEGVFNYPRGENFRVTAKGTSKPFAVYTIPSEAVRQGPSGLQAIMERSIEAFGKEFIQWQKSNLRRAHREEVFAALFDEEERERLLTKGLTAADFAAVEELMDNNPPTLSTSATAYTLSDFTHHTCLTDGRAAELLAMLMDKRQAIFYGPPGTGKTFVARHLGRLLTGLADPPPERLTVVQFHPAYGYEEFIEGIRPRSETGEDGRAVIDYPVRPGAFVRFCREAAQYGDQPCVFIIDEINRGNIPRIFGELMLLLEYRDQSIPLPYSGDRFRIPPNVCVIGTMNTADRSIALVDFALRRRFHFARFAADPELFDRWLDGRPAPPWLGDLYRRLTEEAIDDEDYRIGPSVFMRDDLSEEGARRAWEWSVLPWLREYYIDQPARAELWAWDGELLHGIRGNNGG